jgi:hypothetical protein
MRTIALTSILVFGVMAAPALSQPPPPHDHLLTVPGTGEQVQVAPRRCGLGETVDRGFLNFHFNVHVGVPGVRGGLIITPVFC